MEGAMGGKTGLQNKSTFFYEEAQLIALSLA